MKFDMKSPCDNCPFRTDVKPFLHPQRAAEICNALVNLDQTFSCHKTNSFEENEHGEEEVHETNKSQHCAGAMIMLMKMGQPNQLMRIAAGLKLFDPSKLDLKATVYKTASAMVRAYRRVRM